MPSIDLPSLRRAATRVALRCAVVATVAGCGGASQEAQTGTPGGVTADLPGAPTMHILAAETSLSDALPDNGGTTSPTLIAVREFHVDPLQGDDGASGRSATPDSAGNGPWRTLARLATEALQPGDHVVLACGGVWHESLRIAASGSTSAPIVVRSSEGCATPPVIDGSQPLPAGAWERHAGLVLRQPVQGPILGLFGPVPLAEAHHPNRGHDAARPNSVFLSMAGDGDQVAGPDGRIGSSRLSLNASHILPTGATLGAGLRLRIRVNEFHLEERLVAAVEAGVARLDAVTYYPLEAGWGYFMLGASWMLDSPGEWFFDAAAGRVLWWPAGADTTRPELHAVVRPVGIDLAGRHDVVLDGLSLRRVGTAVSAAGTQSVQVRNLSVEQTVGVGIDASGSLDLHIVGSRFSRTGSDAIHGGGLQTPAAQRMQVIGNLVSGTGVLMDQGANLALPGAHRAAVLAGYAATVKGNVVTESGYIGIRVWAGSRVEGNRVHRACMVLDDCGGIYTWGGPNDSVIRLNTITAAGQPLDGKPPGVATSMSQGIYVDESATGVLVEENTVIDADHGIHIHASAANVVRGNHLFGNRQSQVRVQETRRAADGSPLARDNVISGNAIAAVLPRSVGIALHSAFDSTAGMATLSANRHHDRVNERVVQQSAAGVEMLFDLRGWLARGEDSTSTGTRGESFGALRISDASLVTGTDLAPAPNGWSHWNAMAPSGTIERVACPAGNCLRYSPGGSTGLVSSPYFSVEAGRSYRLSVDVEVGQAAAAPQLIIRRGGGGATPYAALVEAPAVVTIAPGWQRIVVVFRATHTVRVNDPATGDRGARVDLENLSGGPVMLANPDLRPVAWAEAQTVLIANPSAVAASWNCDSASLGAACGQFVRLSDSAAVLWPLTLGPHGAAILYRNDPALADADRDGIADVDDRCAATAAGVPVDGAGCPPSF